VTEVLSNHCDFLDESGADIPGLLHVCFLVLFHHYAALTQCYSCHAVES